MWALLQSGAHWHVVGFSYTELSCHPSLKTVNGSPLLWMLCERWKKHTHCSANVANSIIRYFWLKCRIKNIFAIHWMDVNDKTKVQVTRNLTLWRARLNMLSSPQKNNYWHENKLIHMNVYLCQYVDADPNTHCILKFLTFCLFKRAHLVRYTALAEVSALWVMFDNWFVSVLLQGVSATCTLCELTWVQLEVFWLSLW